ncbi:hypothetical protein DWF00_13535 [Bosea caraganae]|uniref:Uncharacterized protein n=1 Tax=Bosea caraganae TaxID=2763117 RepID=A0A370L199_9HYPH|nr:hypothetical protein [Bosea caraganae]RDJ21332.1 hypothetical protein DWE98_21700 [Bosea caraganae]RDJ26472.1 hypothetical protein DWF00_13535 [Bosea caraganae]
MDPQPPPSRPEGPILAAICGGVLFGFAALAWQAAGGIGVGILGLLVLFIAVRFDLEGNRPIGPEMTPGLYASQFRGDARADHAEKAASRSILKARAGPTQLAMLLGVLLIVIGFGALFLTETSR